MNEMILVERFLNEYNAKVNAKELLGHSDKLVYKVTTTDKTNMVLSIYWPSGGMEYMRENSELYRYGSVLSEAKLLSLINEQSDIETAKPVKNIHDQYVSKIFIDEYDMDVFAVLTSFIEGIPMNDKSPNYLKQAYAAGVTAAKLHCFSEKCIESRNLLRPLHKHQYLIETLNRISLGLDAQTINQERFKMFQKGSETILRYMDALEERREQASGIIHTDLRVANFLLKGNRAIPIDFSRSVYGYFLYDLGEMCAHMGTDDVQREILSGYTSIRKLDTFDMKCIEAFFIMFLFSVVGEFIFKKGMTWLDETVKKLADDYIPCLINGNLFSQKVYDIIS